MSGQHCLLAERDIGAPIFTSANRYVRLAYFHADHLLTGLCKTETEIVEEKTKTTEKNKQTLIATVRSHLRTFSSLSTPLPFHYRLPVKTTLTLFSFSVFPSREKPNILPKISAATKSVPSHCLRIKLHLVSHKYNTDTPTSFSSFRQHRVGN